MYKELKCMFSWVFDVGENTVHKKKKKKLKTPQCYSSVEQLANLKRGGTL